MSLHNVFGTLEQARPHFNVTAAKLYFERGQEILENSCRIIDEENKSVKRRLIPDRVPIYCNSKFRYRTDGSIYEPYEIKALKSYRQKI